MKWVLLMWTSIHFKVTRVKAINILLNYISTRKPEQSGRYFVDHILICVFLNEIYWIVIPTDNLFLRVQLATQFIGHYSDVTIGAMASEITSLTIYLLKRLFRRSSKKTSKLCITGRCEGNSPVTGEFPAQRASNAENVSIWWRHHV